MRFITHTWYSQVILCWIVLAMGSACNGPAQKDLTQEKVPTSSTISNNQQVRITPQSLPGDNVHWGLQDQAGNLWFGTTGDGIYKYDGKAFTQFTAADGLESEQVWCLLEDKSGMLWVGTNDGIYQYKEGQFTKVPITQPTGAPSGTYDVWGIMQDKSGKLWFATGIGVYTYDGSHFTAFDVGPSTTNSCKFSIEMILEDNAGNFWFGGRCNPGVYRYDGSTITHLRPNGDDWTWPVLQDKQGNIWFSSWKGAYRYDGTSFKFFTKKEGLSGDMVARMLEDQAGNLWFGGDGLSRYDGTTFTHFGPEDGLTNTSIWTILEDNAGIFWIGTRETGLYRYDGERFIKFSE